MLDKKSYKLLKTLYKADHLTYAEIDKVLKMNTPESQLNKYSQNLLRGKLIDQHFVSIDDNGDYVYDGFEINLAGRAYVEDKRYKFWSFFFPYVITTLIAIMSLLSTIISDYEKFLDVFSKISQILF